jgi:sensor histidine kinase YesM
MNLKHEWTITFFIVLAFTICFLLFIDIAYDERIWEFGPFTLKARFRTIGVIIVFFCCLSYLFPRIAHASIKKNKDEKKAHWKEYMFVFLISFTLLNLGHIFIFSYVTQMPFRVKESLLINVAGTILSFLYYTMVRNRILSGRFIEQSLQLEKVKVDQLETELKFLKSQYHPHFLFNALNTIYFQIDEQNTEAKQSIEQLSGLLRYQLYDIEQEVTIEQEINYLRLYIAFQQLRMSERLVLDLYFDPELKEQKIHPLLFQPLIENAFKYVRGEYNIQLEMKLNESRSRIQFEIRNSISQSQNTSNKKDKGIGIENLKRRLDLLYPSKYNLEIKQTESLFIVKLTISAD